MPSSNGSATLMDEGRAIETIKEWLVSVYKIPPALVKADSELLRDLGVNGDDGIELIQDYASRFGVDTTELDLATCFESEGFSITRFVSRHVRHLVGSSSRAERVKRRLTVGDLVGGVLRRVLS